MSVTQADVPQWARAVRGKLGLSQSKLAAMLGVSSRAVQSYEQGWRAMPRPVASQLMTVLAIHCDHSNQSPPCWSLTGCPDETRGRCQALKVGQGRFCWVLSGSVCGNRRAPGSAAGPQPCIGCVVMRNLLDGPSRPTVAGPAPSAEESKQEEQK
jgi:DNA-binding XRE family transcriptional regulator